MRSSKCLAMIAILIAGLGSQVYAAPAATTATGITVSPAIIQIQLAKGQDSASFASQVTNNTSSVASLSLQAMDFTSLNQNGGVSFLTGNSNNGHGLAKSLLISSSEVSLQPGQSQSLPVTITNVSKLAAGGHYAALMYRLNSPGNNKGNNVSVQQTVTSLIFLTTFSQGTQTTDLTTPVVNSLLTAFPQTLNLVFTNNGNTQTTPRGIVQVLDPAGKQVSRAAINVNSGLILPQSKRLFSFSIPRPGGDKLFRPGIYKLRIIYKHDGQKNYSVYEQRFLFINLPLLLAAIATLLLVIIIMFRKFVSESFYYRLKKQL